MKSLAALALAAAACLLAGCVSSKYKLAKPETPPAVPLNVSASTTLPFASGSTAARQSDDAGAPPTVAAMLHSVIVYQGPGSWKREAFWDEYVLSLVNRSATPLVIESATLTDFQGTSNPPGTDPWKLEGESKTWWQKVRSSQTGNLLALGAGAVGVGATLTVASIAAAGGILAPATTASTVLVGAAAVTVVAAPIYAVTVIVINSSNKSKVVAEFQRRLLALPLTLDPGATAQGSLFFRISPAPSRLALRGRHGDAPFDVVVDLTSLGHLHLKSAASIKPALDTQTATP